MNGIITAAAWLAAMLPGAAGATTFAINRDINGGSGVAGGGSVKGTITTDGTTGVLNILNITGVDLELSLWTDGYTRRIDRTNASWNVVGSALSATATELLFDFGATDGSYTYFSTVNIYFAPFWCLQASGACIDQGGPGEGVQVYDRSVRTARSGVIGVAAAGVPEPAAWTTMLAGFGLVGAGMRARRKGVVFA